MNLNKTNCILNKNRLGCFLMLSSKLCISSSIPIGEFWEIFKSSFLTEHLWTNASKIGGN